MNVRIRSGDLTSLHRIIVGKSQQNCSKLVPRRSPISLVFTVILIHVVVLTVILWAAHAPVPLFYIILKSFCSRSDIDMCDFLYKGDCSCMYISHAVGWKERYYFVLKPRDLTMPLQLPKSADAAQKPSEAAHYYAGRWPRLVVSVM